ncbi:hypothetical protein [Streptomyces sp. WAC 04229]|nr:hypothetical protein [Streptomyces sp. WAC 04229]
MAGPVPAAGDKTFVLADAVPGEPGSVRRLLGCAGDEVQVDAVRAG